MDKKNSKLESFLKRALPSAVFSDIRYYEGCVVRVAKGPLCFKYLVVTGKALLVADYPPRAVHEIVKFSDVTSIRVEHDFPDFLKGPLRETCQHIRVGHRKNSLQDVEEEEATPSPLESWKSPPQPDTASLATIPPVAAPRERPDHRRTFTPEPGAARDSPDIGALLQRVGSARPHIPRSRSSLAQYTQPAQHADVTRRAHSSLDKPRSKRAEELEDILNVAKPSFVRESEIHVYVLQGSSSNLLSQLQSCWCARLLSSTLELADKKASSPSQGRDVHQLETLYEQYKRELMDPANSLDHSFDLLQELQVGLQRNVDLKKVFWKDQMLYHFLTQRLQLFLMEPCTPLVKLDPDHLLASRVDELEAATLLLDILLATLRDSDCIHDKLQMLQFNGGSVLKALLTLLVTPPNIPHRYYNTCSRMLEDFHEFCSSGWSNLPEAELIRLLAEVTNISTSILYELLLTLRKLIHNNSTIKLAKLLEGVALECHLKRSVTQLLGMLFPPQAHKLKPLEAVLVYQHFYVLKSLMESLTRVQDYIQEQFEEEFRYYIHWSRVSRKLSDSYPIKRLLQQLVDGVHQLASRRHADQPQSLLFTC
ncbi:uncharacterized protein C12orf56-like [Periplaneta americana]|uniref:uncharacterized protein C12orf56-like n=1 Tax=Periplaneta americana TaxID=6978 RepID=UPI0037E8FC55